MQQIWDEVGETDDERDNMLLQIDQECLDVYKRKVDQAVKSRAHLLQALADAKLELSRLLSSLGEKTYVGIVSDLYFIFVLDGQNYLYLFLFEVIMLLAFSYVCFPSCD